VIACSVTLNGSFSESLTVGGKKRRRRKKSAKG
jgi:hypothetical protein